MFTALFGLRLAVPMLTLTQVPAAVLGGPLLVHAPLGPLKRLLGVVLAGVLFLFGL